jgi:hypothetical protein
MISIKHYLEQPQNGAADSFERGQAALLPVTLGAYRSALVEMGNCAQDAGPALGEELKLLKARNPMYESNCKAGAVARPCTTGNRPVR